MRLAGAAAAIALVTFAPSATAAPRADLRPSPPTKLPASAAPGGSFDARDSVRNAGPGKSPRSLTRWYLSADKSRGKGDMLIGSRKVGALKARKSSQGIVKSRLPAVLAPGSFFVLACADDTKKVKETSERNNCAASRSRVSIVVGAPAPAPAPETGTPAPEATGSGSPAPVPGSGIPSPGTGGSSGGDGEQGGGTPCPGTTDVPDPAFADSDCDGIDGQISDAVFVSAVDGVDGFSCGTRGAPCRSIPTAIDRAVALGRHQVYLAGGTYADSGFLVADGISVYGGFGSNFQRDPALATGSTTTTVQGSQDMRLMTGEFRPATVVVVALTEPVTIADLTIVGPDASGQDSTGRGLSSFAIYAREVPAGLLTITRNTIVAGDGADGADGSAGMNAASLTAPAKAGSGGNGDEFDTTCNSSSRGGGGTAGTNSAGDYATGDMTGGAGGAGGTMDTNCGVFSSNFDARPGSGGFNAPVVAGLFGTGGSGGSGTDACGPATSGHPGVVVNGSAGSAGAANGLLSSGLWTPGDGTAGAIGHHGGGGGGGGGGGCDQGTDAYGGGGGGGGAGGAAAQSGGGGGHGGGASFAIYLDNASPEVTSNVITRGNGGNGGAGGDGGTGQPGGAGGDPGAHPGSTTPGTGGMGGHGGHGGGGGGGAGGIAAGLFSTSALSVPALTANTIAGGSAGSGGAGGQSGPDASPSDDDGNDGPTGAAGSVVLTYTCATPAGC